MIKKTAEEIIEIILQNFDSYSSANNNWHEINEIPEILKTNKEFNELNDSFDYKWKSNHKLSSMILEALGLGEVEEVYQEGGDSSSGEYWESVKYFKEHDVYLKWFGKYTSYSGHYFDDDYITEVKPIEKKIIVYE